MPTGLPSTWRSFFRLVPPPEVHAVRGPGMEWHHLAAGVHGRRSEQCQLERIAIEARHFLRELRIDSQVAAGGIELNRDGRVAYSDALSDSAWPKAGIDRDIVACLNLDVFLNEFGEPGRLNRYRVGAGIDQVKDKQPGLAGIADDLDRRC